MPSFEYEYSGHHFNFDHVLLEVYRLMSYVLARRVIEEEANKHPPPADDPFPELAPRTRLQEIQQKFFAEETSRLLLYTAIAVRTLDDRCPGVFDYYLEESCGEVLEQKGRVRPLKLRDACNKLIHASYVNIDLGLHTPDWWRAIGFDEMSFTPVDPQATVIFHGEASGSRKWAGVLDLFLYTDLVVKSIKFHKHQEIEALDR